MLIIMKETRRISEDGRVTRYLEKGNTYEVGDTAARAAIRAGHAEEAQEDPTESLNAVEALYQALKPPTREELERILRSDV